MSVDFTTVMEATGEDEPMRTPEIRDRSPALDQGDAWISSQSNTVATTDPGMHSAIGASRAAVVLDIGASLSPVKRSVRPLDDNDGIDVACLDVDNAASPSSPPAPVDPSISAWHRRASLGSDYSTSSGDSGQDATTSTCSGDDETATPATRKRGVVRKAGPSPATLDHAPDIQTRPDRQPLDCTSITTTTASSWQTTPATELTPATENSYSLNRAHNRIPEYCEQLEEPSSPTHEARNRSDAHLQTTPPNRRGQPASKRSSPLTAVRNTAATPSLNSGVNSTTAARPPRRSDEDDTGSELSDDEEAEEIDSYDECDDSCPLCGEVCAC